MMVCTDYTIIGMCPGVLLAAVSTVFLVDCLLSMACLYVNIL